MQERCNIRLMVLHLLIHQQQDSARMPPYVLQEHKIMYAVIKNGQIQNVYSTSPTLSEGESILKCVDLIPPYDRRIQVISSPPSFATAPERYNYYSDRVDRLFTVENIPLANLRRSKCDEINTLRGVKEQSGFTYDDKEFDSDVVSVIRLTTSLSATDCPPYWKTISNDLVAVDHAYLQGMVDALKDSANDLFIKSNTHKEAINALDSAIDIVNYDVNINW